MQLGVFFFGNVDMPDAGWGGPDPQDRRSYQADWIKQYDDLLAYSQAAERAGFDSVWLAEHHFQHEGYEVTPNILMTSLWLAAKTERIKYGGMFNVIPQWHPLKFAEDFAFADVVTRGRMLCGIGRGTVPRESTALGARMGWNDSPDDQFNRELFEEQVDVIKTAWYNETFSYKGRFYTLPAEGLDDRGRTVETLTLIPKPFSVPVEIWQPVTSPKTYRYVASQGHKAVYWMMSRPRLKQGWKLYQDLYEETHPGERLRKGQHRMVVINVTIADTTQQAIELARHGHDEYWKFLGPYGRQVNYLDDNSQSWPPNRYPTIEESMAQGPWVIGSAAEVRDNLARLQEELGVEYLTIFPHYPGMVREQVVDQIERFMAEVAPTLRKQAEAIEQAPPGMIDTTGMASSEIKMAQAKTRETIAAGIH
jgi:alkanesulfonate monooxygenase SsuD/methylene tetrahydromethanopterin reductase-like flavin-dependent oxidoreductase (luciferase family)